MSAGLKAPSRELDFVRGRIRQARRNVGETQGDLARILGKTRVAVSDLERGRVSIGVYDLIEIARHYQKPISYFFPPIAEEGELALHEKELLLNFHRLPETQQRIALAYIKLQAASAEKIQEDPAKRTVDPLGVRRIRKAQSGE